MITPLVSVVIPTNNRKRDLLHCIDSVRNSSHIRLEIIVVDNASTDGTTSIVKKGYPDVKLLTLKKNTGVTGGRNAGAKVAKGDYVFFVDHDLVLDRDAISELVNVMEHDHAIGLAGPTIYYYDDPKRIWAAGTSVELTSGRVSFNTDFGVEDGNSRSLLKVQVLPAPFLVRREVIDTVGLFDDTFFAVYEDTDFCFRVWKAGYAVVCVPRAKTWHKIPLDRQKQEQRLLGRSYYIARNRIILMSKHAEPWAFRVFLFSFVPLYAAYYIFRSLRLASSGSMRQYWRGLLDGFRLTM